MRKFSLILSIALCPLLFSACNGSNGPGGPDAVSGEFLGTWDATYNLVSDDCGLLEEGQTGFLDEHVISAGVSDLSLSAAVDFGLGFNGVVEEDRAARFNQAFEGDVFGDGIPCQVTQEISYQGVDTNKATTLFERNIQCDDGFACAARALGDSVRRQE